MPQRSNPSRAARCSAPSCSPTSIASSKPTGTSARDEVRVMPEIIDRGNGRVDLVYVITGGREDAGAPDRLHRQSGLRHAAAQCRHQDLGKIHAELPDRRRCLRSRPRRAGSGTASPLLSQQGLCRCQRARRPRRNTIPADKGICADFRHRRRSALPVSATSASSAISPAWIPEICRASLLAAQRRDV